MRGAARGKTGGRELEQKNGRLLGIQILSFCRLHFVACFALFSALWVLFLYWHALGGTFVYDDIPQIAKNPALASWHSVAHYFRSPVPFNNEFRGFAGSFYRPLFWLSLAVDRHIWGLHPAGFHLTNLLLHWANGLLGFLLLRKMGTPVLLSVVTCLLWLALPINSEAVAWISGRPICLMGVFVFLALLIADAYLRSGRLLPLLCYFGAVLGALLSHEAGMLALPLTSVIAYARDRRVRRSWIALAATAVGAAVLYLAMRAFAGAQMPGGSSAIFRVGISFWKYLGWIILPVRMSIERSTDLLGSHFSTAALMALIGVAALLLLILRLRGRIPALAAGLAWMSIALLPFCGFVFIYQGMAERYTYLASEGFALAVVAIALRAREWARPIAFLSLIMWVGWGAWRLNARVLDYSDEVMLYTQSLAATPRSSVLLYNLGIAAADRGETARAIEYYQRAVDVNGKYVSAMIDLGNVLGASGRYSEAIALFRRAMSLDSQSPDAWIDLGNVYGRMGSLEEAKSAYERAVALQADNTEARINLGVTLQRLGDFVGARRQYERVIAINPHQPATYCDLGALLVQQGDAEGGLKQFLKAVEIDSSYAPAYFDAGVVYEQTGRVDLARTMYEKALEIKPDYQKARLNLEHLQSK